MQQQNVYAKTWGFHHLKLRDYVWHFLTYDTFVYWERVKCILAEPYRVSLVER